MRRNQLLFFCFLLYIFFCSFTLASKEFNVVVAQLPTSDYYANLIKAIGEETKNNFKIEVVPMARSIYSIENNAAELQCPIIENPNPNIAAQLKYDYSTVTIYQLVFVLYTNKAKKISADELKKGNAKNYTIETDIAHVNYFGFSCSGSTSIEASLKKVDGGLIDGYIYSTASTDIVLKKLNLKNITRQFYNKYNIKFMLVKGQKNGELDKILTNGMAILKRNNKFEQIIGSLIKDAENYNNWQP